MLHIMNGYDRMMLALDREIPDTVPIFEILGEHLREQVCPGKPLPDPLEEGRLESLREMVKRFKGRKAIVFAVWSSFIYPSFLRGFEHYLMDFFDNPEFVLEINERFSRNYEKQIYAAAAIGADCIMESEDFCGKTGPFMSLSHFKEFCMPGLKIVSKAAKHAGLKFIKHSDGYVWPLLDCLIGELQADAYHPSEPVAGMDIRKVKEVYGDRTCVIGNIDCSHLLPFGTEKEIEDAVRQCVEENKPGGGYILSSSNCVHAAIPLKNLLAMIRAGRTYGKY